MLCSHALRSVHILPRCHTSFSEAPALGTPCIACQRGVPQLVNLVCIEIRAQLWKCVLARLLPSRREGKAKRRLLNKRLKKCICFCPMAADAALLAASTDTQPERICMALFRVGTVWAALWLRCGFLLALSFSTLWAQASILLRFGDCKGEVTEFGGSSGYTWYKRHCESEHL